MWWGAGGAGQPVVGGGRTGSQRQTQIGQIGRPVQCYGSNDPSGLDTRCLVFKKKRLINCVCDKKTYRGNEAMEDHGVGVGQVDAGRPLGHLVDCGPSSPDGKRDVRGVRHFLGVSVKNVKSNELKFIAHSHVIGD